MYISVDPIVVDLARNSLLKTCRRAGIRQLEAAGDPSTELFRRVERLIRVAVALSPHGAETKVRVQVHCLTSDPNSPFDVPETCRVDPAKLLAD